jgi:hypothetical protein
MSENFVGSVSTRKTTDENVIYVVVVYSLNERGEPKEVHNHGWWSKLEDAKEYMQLAGTPVEGESNSFYEDPFEMRWDYVMIEKVSEGALPEMEVVAHYKAEWYTDPDYERDESVTDLVNTLRNSRGQVLMKHVRVPFNMRACKFKVVELDEAPFDISQLFGFSGM